MVKIYPKMMVSVTIGFLVFLALAAVIAVYFILKSEEAETPALPSQGKTPEEILNSLAAPSGDKTEIQKKILESLAPPPKENKTSEEISQSLAAPAK